jgi:hypothetical protein
MRSNGRHALARDVEGWRSLFGVGRIGGSSNDIHSTGIEEGLDERGEAPPPYAPGSKPLSVRIEDLRRQSTSSSGVGNVDLGTRSRDGIRLPGYHEHSDLGFVEAIIRPETAVTASERFRSMRRLMGSSASSRSSTH